MDFISEVPLLKKMEELSTTTVMLVDLENTRKLECSDKV
jgi:hypothetical protein